MSIDGDTMVIGAHHDDDDGSNSGSAYVFTRDTAGDLASGWTQVAKLTAADGAEYDHFGRSVSIDGDTVVIGSQRDADQGIESGSAYVFTRDTAGDLASSWTQVAKLTADDGAGADHFGFSVSIDGDTVVIGRMGLPYGMTRVGVCVRIRTDWLVLGVCAARNGSAATASFPRYGEAARRVRPRFTAVTASAVRQQNLFPGECRCSRGYPRSYHGNWPCSIERRMEL